MCKMIRVNIFPVETMVEDTNGISYKRYQEEIFNKKRKRKTYFTVDSISATPVLLRLFMDDWAFPHCCQEESTLFELHQRKIQSYVSDN